MCPVGRDDRHAAGALEHPVALLGIDARSPISGTSSRDPMPRDRGVRDGRRDGARLGPRIHARSAAPDRPAAVVTTRTTPSLAARSLAPPPPLRPLAAASAKLHPRARRVACCFAGTPQRDCCLLLRPSRLALSRVSSPSYTRVACVGDAMRAMLLRRGAPFRGFAVSLPLEGSDMGLRAYGVAVLAAAAALWAMSGTQREKPLLASTAPEAVRALEAAAVARPTILAGDPRARAGLPRRAAAGPRHRARRERRRRRCAADVRVQHVYARALVDEGRNDEALAVESASWSRRAARSPRVGPARRVRPGAARVRHASRRHPARARIHGRSRTHRRTPR